MTNAEKYEEVFGMPVDNSNCPTSSCKACPCAGITIDGYTECIGASTYEWWKEEYKGVSNG